jgi:hypothetical protein
VRADGKTHVDGILQRHRDGSGSGELSAGLPGQHREVVSAPLDADSHRSAEVALGLLLGLQSRSGRGRPVLQRSQAIPVQRHIGVRGICIEALADHERSLTMRHGAGADEVYIGSECHVTGHFLPGELEGVGHRPDVGAAAGDPVLAASGIELHFALLRGDTHVGTRLELSESLREADRRQTAQGEGS